ncbi:hypothetical protein AALP_AA6G280000 [Arabis alpina]|uniref:Uncharacterized protein n=1 Tax=Arabis alpina TaxID=50452 RepID=A0A087GS68_ARAAL|nr:hypothetical protein AALP_AA6G280000 [Arabis alpina]
MEKFEYLNDFQVAAEKLIHSYGILPMVTLFLRWVASFAAIFLMILDGTKWKSTNMSTSLLAPYLFTSLPLVVFEFLRREFGKWIALLTVVLKLFFPKHFPESLEIPGATFLLIVVAPTFIVDVVRDPPSLCLMTSLCLLTKHTKDCGGYKNSFTQNDKITCTIFLYLLFLYSLWYLAVYPFYDVL